MNKSWSHDRAHQDFHQMTRWLCNTKGPEPLNIILPSLPWVHLTSLEIKSWNTFLEMGQNGYFIIIRSASPCRTIEFLGVEGGNNTLFLLLTKKEIILTGHGEEENSFLPVVTIKSSQPFFSLILQHQPSSAGAPWVHKQATFGIMQVPWISSRFLLPQRGRSQAQLQGWWLRKLFPKREYIFYIFLAIA